MTEQIEIPASFAGGADVTGKRVVITGASRGLGRLLAHAFSQAGARVALVARTETDLKAVAEELPGPSLVLGGDVTDAEFNEAVADATVAEWGGVDVWICNAGISPIVAGPLKTDPAVWREILDVNLTGAFLGARAAARVMRDGGRLIFTGSVLGERPREGLTAYSASKAGLVGMAKGLALDLALVGHHRERRRAGLVRLAAGRAVEEQPRARSERARPHRAAAVGQRRPTWPARTSSSPPTRRRSSPAPCSTSTADTCSYEQHVYGESSRSPARAARSAPRCRHSSRASPTPTSCSATSARRRSTPPSTACRSARGAVETLLADVGEITDVEAVVALAVERFGRLDVLISNAGVLAPNGRIHNLTTEDWERVVPRQRARRGQRHPGRGAASCARRSPGRSSSPRRSPVSPRGRTRRRTARRRRP